MSAEVSLTRSVGRHRAWTRPGAGTLIASAIAVVLALAFVAPIVWSAISSLKTPAEAAAVPPTVLPSQISFENYNVLLHYDRGLLHYLANTTILAGLTTFFTVVVSVLAGYGFSRYSFPLKRLLFGLVLAVLMVPFPALLLPLYLTLNRLHLLNSLVGLSLVLTTFQLPFAVFMMRNSFDSVPQALEEAARVDGARTFEVMRDIALRIVMPGIVTVALFAFLAAWNEFLGALIFLTDSDKFTLPVMLTSVQTGELGSVTYGPLQAGVTLAMLPCVALFLLLQRYYVNGLIAGALKS
jgi:multiple sugar transport system permease protein